MGVGDIVKVLSEEQVPADILVLGTERENGDCWIQTHQLDGETSMKRKTVLNLQDKSFIQLHCTPPNKNIDAFQGYVVPSIGSKSLVSIKNLMLRGSILTNTSYVEGLVVFTGHQTKLLLNSSSVGSKKSKLERRLNFDVILCAVLLLLICVQTLC